MTISSAGGILALLSEDDPTLLHYALTQLSTTLVHTFWTEISESIAAIEQVYENNDVPQETRKLAALLASKVYYHLGSLDDALSFALAAEELFSVDGDGSDSDDYTQTIIATCIDRYIEARQTAADDDHDGQDGAAGASSIMPVKGGNTSDMNKMKSIVEQMVAKCIRDKEYRQALGIALDSKRLDVIERIFGETKDAALLSYVLETVMTVIVKLDFRNKVLRLLVSLYSSLPSPDHFSQIQCYVHLNDPTLAADLLKTLLSSTSSSSPTEEPLLKAYQIAFDLADTASQEFLTSVRNTLTIEEGASSSLMDTDETRTQEASSSSTSSTTNQEGKARVISILTGRETIKLHLEFLYRNSRVDLQTLNKTKSVLESRNSIYHSAITFNNAFQNAATCSDKWIRENLDWLLKASNWSKFSATAALGVIHRGNLDYGYDLLQPYLPGQGNNGGGAQGSSVYSEGGALYALGLIHANCSNASSKSVEALEFLKNSTRAEGGEVIQHGAALGLGVAAMATGSEEIYDQLRETLFSDSAVAGEAAGYAMGLVMLGTGSAKALEEMLQYAHETQHEKIIRGLAVGISLLFYGKQEEADACIETLMSDKDPILRYGGCHTIAMAYVGTAANSAIRKLLHVAVSDVNDDVRRAAVTGLGFILCRQPSLVPKIVELLSESYNPHLRYGATLALGISCASTGSKEAIDILLPLTKDPIDFVKQGACIALSMILVQQNNTLNNSVNKVRELFENILKDKTQDPMTKFGASLSQGIIDAAGRNVAINTINSKNGNLNMSAIVGLNLFTQFWYWFPLAHCLVLSFKPTAIIGVDSKLKLPKFEFISNIKPEVFAYVPEAKAAEKDKVEKVATAVLSTTAKASARQKEKEREKAEKEGEGDVAMEAEGTTTTTTEKEKHSSTIAEPVSGPSAAGDASDMQVDASSAAAGTKSKKEATSEHLPNLSRVVPAQVPYISFPSSSRFSPIRPFATSTNKPLSSSPAYILESIVNDTTFYSSNGAGIIVLKDEKPEEGDSELVEKIAERELRIAALGEEPVQQQQEQQGGAQAAQPPAYQADAAGPIADMPEPFEYDDFED